MRETKNYILNVNVRLGSAIEMSIAICCSMPDDCGSTFMDNLCSIHKNG